MIAAIYARKSTEQNGVLGERRQGSGHLWKRSGADARRRRSRWAGSLNHVISLCQHHRRRPKSPYPLSSFLSSLKKRQSVPWVMIFCGVDLIIPASLRRKAKKRMVSSGLNSRQRV
jgi:hypothetical protein